MAEVAFDADDPLLARAAWSRVSEPGDRVAGALLAQLGPVAALAWLLSGADQPPGVRAHHAWGRAAQRWRPRLSGLDPRREIAVITRLGGEVLIPEDPRWPGALEDLAEAAPPCLWVRGDTDVASLARNSVAIVGARANTSYGADVASELATGLALRGVSVVSGGAYGIDACAHRGLLASGGCPIAVMAGGLDRFYPAAHTDLLLEVVREGAVISEVPPGSAPMRQRFLARNRLIAALAQVTVVVEAGWRSGALSTARHAAELLRPVAVVPGPVTSMASAGCHRLLREGGAICVTDVSEVLELLPGAEPASPMASEIGILDGLDPDQARVFDALPKRASADPDNLARVSGLSVAQTVAALGALELAGRVNRVGGGWCRRPPRGDRTN
ncbi:MAG: DNA-processing protein DprA [Beutenbergiaceae bacterium]